MMRKRMTEIDTFIWSLAGVVAIVLGMFPTIIMWVAAQLGITWPPSLLLLIAIVGLGLIVFRQSTEISELQSKLTDLTMNVSLNKQDVDRLQDEVLPPTWNARGSGGKAPEISRASTANRTLLDEDSAEGNR